MKAIYAILLMSAMLIAAASAQPGRGDGAGMGLAGEKGQGRPVMLIDNLGLTPEQQKAVRAARDEWMEQSIDLRGAVQKAKLAVRRELTAETVNRDAIMSAVEKEAAAELELRKAMVDHQLKIREIVGPEKAEQLMEMMRDQRGGGPRGDRPRQDPRD